MKTTWRKAWERSICGQPWSGSTPALHGNGSGSTCFRLAGCQWPSQWPGASASYPRECPATGCEGGSRTGWIDQTGELPCPAPFLRDPSPGRRLRYPHGAGTARPCRCLDDYDLYACAEHARTGGEKPGRCIEAIARSHLPPALPAVIRDVRGWREMAGRLFGSHPPAGPSQGTLGIHPGEMGAVRGRGEDITERFEAISGLGGSLLDGLVVQALAGEGLLDARCGHRFAGHAIQAHGSLLAHPIAVHRDHGGGPHNGIARGGV